MQQKQTTEERLAHIFKTFAGRIKRSSDPVVQEAAHQMERELNKVCAPQDKKVK